MKLICEYDMSHKDLEVIVEQQNPNGKKNIRVRGPYIVAEEKNANGRIYDQGVMESAVSDYYENYINTNRSVGEMEHPDNTEIDFNNACHIITDLKQEGNVWVGESRVLCGLPKGDILAGLLENGVAVGMSSRGVGNITHDDRVDDYKLVAVDVVSNPSAPGAWVNGILECKNYMIDQHGQIVEQVYRDFENKLAKLPRRSDDKAALFVNAFKEFFERVK